MTERDCRVSLAMTYGAAAAGGRNEETNNSSPKANK